MSQAIDVSNHNGVINWDKVKASGVVQAWTKATEGLTFLDAYLQSNLSGMRGVGVADGTYHFARPAVGNAQRQADWYVDSVLKAGGFGVLAPVLDIEVTGGLTKTQLTDWMTTWLQRVESRTGRVPVIYTYTSFGDESFDSTEFSRYPLWIANYGVPRTALPPGWSNWTYWQYTDKGHVDGIVGDVDMDYISGEVPNVAQTLMQGASGDAVKTLQENLKTVLGLGASFAVDGQYGPATTAAVKSFQLQNHLTVDGIAGPQTLSALSKAVSAMTQPKSTAPAVPAKPASEPIPTPSQAPTVENTTSAANQTNSAPVVPDTADIKGKIAQVSSLLAQAESILNII